MARYSWEARVPPSAAPHTPLATPRPPQLSAAAIDGVAALPPSRPYSVHARRDPSVFIGSAVVKAAAPCDLRQQTPPRPAAADTKCPPTLFAAVPPPPPPTLPSSRPSTQGGGGGGGGGGSNVGQLQALRFRRLREQQSILDAAMGLQTVASLRKGFWGVGGCDSGGGRLPKTRGGGGGGGDADAARMVRRRARLHLRAAAAAAAEERQQIADHPTPGGRHLLLAASSSSAAPTDAAEAAAAATGGSLPPSPPSHAARIESGTDRRPPSVDEVLPLPLVRHASEATTTTIAAAPTQVSPPPPPQPTAAAAVAAAAAANPDASEQLLEELIQCKSENLQLLGGLMSKVARHEAAARDAEAALRRHEEGAEALRAELEAEKAAHRTLSRQHADQQHQTRTLRTQVRKLRERAAGFAAGAAAAAAAATSPQGQPAPPPGESGGESLELRGQMIQHAYHALDETKLIAASYKRQLEEAREQHGRTAARAAALEERLQTTRMLLRERKRHADAEERMLEEDASGLRYPPPDGPHAATSVETLRYTPRPNFPILLKERHGICTRHKPTATILREILQKLEAKQQRVAELSDAAEVSSGLRAIVDDYRAGRGGAAAPAPAHTAHASATIMTFQSQFAPVEFLDTPYRTVRNRGWSRSATLSACVNCFEAAWDTSAALDAGGWKATTLAARAALLAGAAIAAAATAPLMARHARALAKQQRAEQRLQQQQQQQQQQQTPRRPPTRTAPAQPPPAPTQAAETEEFRDNQSQCSRWQRIMALVHRGSGGGAAQAFQVTFVPTAAAAAGYVAQVQCKEADDAPAGAVPGVAAAAAAAAGAPASPKAREASAAAPPPPPRAGRHARSASEAVVRQIEERCPNFYLIEVTEGLFSRVFQRWLNQSFRQDEEAKATLAYNLLHHSQMFAREEPMCMLFLSLTTKALPLAVFTDVKVVLKTVRDAVARHAEDATELRISYEDCLSAIEDAFLGKPAVDVVKAQCAMRADFASSVSRQISYQGGFDLTEKMSELARYCAAYAVTQHADVYKAVESLLTAHPSGEELTLSLLGRMLEQHFHLSPYLPPFNIKAFLAKVQSAFELTEGSLSVPDVLSALRSVPLQITDELRRVT